MGRFLIHSILFLTALIYSWTQAFAEVDPEESEFNPSAHSVKIMDFSYNGSGCPQGSVLGDVSPDNEVITLIFSDYRVEKLANEPAGAKRNCAMRFTLDAPAGWSHAVFSMNVQGYADLQPGLVGIQNLGYSYADGSGRNPLGKMRIEGPYADDYVRSEQISTSALSWSSCSKNRHQILVNSAIAIESQNQQGKAATGMMTVDVMENVLEGGSTGKVTQQFGVLWKRCPNGPQPTKKSVFALCRVQLKNAQTGSLVREITIKSRAKDADKALAKANRRAQKRCQNVTNRRGQRMTCSFNPSGCSVVNID